MSKPLRPYPADPRAGVARILVTVVLVAAFLAPLAMIREAASARGAVTTSYLNLRSGPRLDQRVRLVMPPGAWVEVIGGPRRGFYKVVYNGRPGWAHGDYLDFDDDGGGGGGGGTATVIDGALNLRAGPSTADRVLLVMPDGARVELTGESANGFLGVIYQGTRGWAYAAYLDTGGGGSSSPGGGGGGGGGSAVTTTALNLRSGPSTSDSVIVVMPAGATVEVTGDPRNGFYPVTYNGRSGWAYGDYLSFGGSSPGGGGGSSNIIWPFSGGAWEIIQGYNGGTHQGQYYYAFDLARTDGNTAGQDIYAPVSGTVLWNDPNSGGLAINMGNGYALAMFHVTFRSDLGRGDWVTQGEYLGYISPPGGAGYQVTPHVDMTLWDISGGGRVAAPYVGQNAISGMEFPDVGGWNQYGGRVIRP